MVEIPAPNGVKFCIDRTEVTQQQYAEFLAKVSSKPGSEHPECKLNAAYAPSTNPDGPGWEIVTCPVSKVWTPEATPNRPVVCVDWCDAQAYCAWAGKRLCGKIGGGTNDLSDPSHATNAALSQWYSACSQGGKTKYPYGAVYEPQSCEGAEVAKYPDGGFQPKKDVAARVDCRGEGAPYNGLLGMSGSVDEWTDECRMDGAAYTCLTRGGNFASIADYLGCDFGGGGGIPLANPTTGFRCCKDLL